MDREPGGPECLNDAGGVFFLVAKDQIWLQRDDLVAVGIFCSTHGDDMLKLAHWLDAVVRSSHKVA